jgi:hypothetical protein
MKNTIRCFFSVKNAMCIALISATTSLLAQSFTKVTSGPVVSTAGDSRSVNWVDVNHDGLIDLFISNGKVGGQNNMLYLNTGGGNFVQETTDTIVKDGKPSDGATFADCDNDGDLDAYVVNWYNQPNLFYTNNGNGSFTHMPSSPVITAGGFCETASWGDYDNDGLVDLYVTRSGGSVASNKNGLYHNDGGNAFTKIVTGAPVTDAFVSRSVNWTDIDIDGDLDLFVTNEGGGHENMYRNDGAGVFTKITTGPLVTNAGNTMSSSWGDYDNDGDQDVFLANQASSNALFRNDGNFVFTKITADTVSKTNAHSFSSAWSDFDNDGDLDLFVTNGFYTTQKQLCFLYFNNGNGSFTRVNNTIPATDSTWAYGCAAGDYDNDGFEDLAVATVTFNGVDLPDLLYHNDGNANHWITIKLNGTTTNKSAIGTKVRLKATINGNAVWQYREISAQSAQSSQGDMRAHFGLGNATVIDSVIVEWLSGTDEIFTNIATNQFITIVEGQGIVGMNDGINTGDGISVFPNPSPGVISIMSPLKSFEKGSVVSITDVKATTIYSEVLQVNTNKIEVNLQQQGINTKGVYQITIQGLKGRIVKRVVLF